MADGDGVHPSHDIKMNGMNGMLAFSSTKSHRDSDFKVRSKRRHPYGQRLEPGTFTYTLTIFESLFYH